MADSYRTKLYKPAAQPSKWRPAYRIKRIAEPQSEAQAAAETDASPAETLPEAHIRKRRVRLWRWALGAVAIGAMLYGGRVAYSVWRFESQVYVPLPTATARAVAPTSTARATAVALDDVPASTATADIASNLPPGRINILVMGTDKRPDDPDHYARSDTMILANLDTAARKVRLMSIPRDLVMRIPGYGLNKVNSAYTFGEYYQEPGGGQGLAVQTVSEFFSVSIDYYVTVNFDGFRKLVDTVGGVNIDVPYELDDYNYPSDDEGDPFGMLHVHFDAGYQHMNGKQALRYARTRHADNDFMRNKRQLQVILGVRNSAMSLNLIPALPNMIDQLAGMVETNIPLDKQVALAQFGYRIEASNIITASIDAEMIYPTTLDDGSEGLMLDTDKAGQMLQDFFGPAWDLDAAEQSMSAKAPTATPVRAAGRAQKGSTTAPKRTPTPAAKKATGRVTVVPTRTPRGVVGTRSTP